MSAQDADIVTSRANISVMVKLVILIQALLNQIQGS